MRQLGPRPIYSTKPLPQDVNGDLGTVADIGAAVISKLMNEALVAVPSP